MVKTKGRSWIAKLATGIAFAWLLSSGFGPGVESGAASRPTLEVLVWRLEYNDPGAERLDWQVFEAASEPAGPVSLPTEAAAASPSERLPQELSRDAEGLARRAFAMRRAGEESLSGSEIQSRIDLFVEVLTEQSGVPRGEEGDSGRRLIVKRDRERVALVDSDVNILKAQVLYESLFPVVVVTYRHEPAPAPRASSPLVIGALKTQHRSPAELESVLNRVSGRTRSSDEDRVEDLQRQDRIPMRVAGDSGSGRMLVAVPARESGGSPQRVEPPPRPSASSGATRATVHVEPVDLPSWKRFRRFGRMDFTALETHLRRLGPLKLLRERTMRVTSGQPLSIGAGWGIPYLRYRPSGDRPEAAGPPAHMRASIHYLPAFLGGDAWEVTLLAELVDYSDYPQIDKIFVDFKTRLRSGDTLVCKRLVAEEISDDRTLRAEAAGPAETLVLLTLVE